MSAVALDLLATLRARGVKLIAAGDRLRWHPREALTPGEVEQLRACKPEVLQALAHVQPRPPALAVSTVIETLGPHPTPGQLKALGVEVAAALGRFQSEIRSGQLGSAPLLVRGRPLADYLPLETVARLLTEGSRRREETP